MAKKKKTRQQKIIADLRRQVTLSKPQESKPETKPKNFSNPALITYAPKIRAVTYPYLKKDLQKTAILTSSVIALQMILYFLLKSHILVLPRLGY